MSSSRKTYFGIGVPGKAPDATEKSPEDDDRSDYSAPTVVDDAKVAEGLKQLRAWYQPEAGEADDDRESVVDAPSEPTKLGMPYPRPTAVGHSTSDTDQPEQRSVAPDPMRGTMFGHDVHRPELDDSSGPSDPLLSSTSEPTDLPPRNAETMRHLAWRGPGADAGAEVAPFADFLRREAARPRQPVGFPLPHAEETDSIAVSRRRITSNVLLAVFGTTAVVTAVLLGLRSGTPEPAPSEAAVGTTGAAPPGATPACNDDRRHRSSVPGRSGQRDEIRDAACARTGHAGTTSTRGSTGDGCAARADCATGSFAAARSGGAARSPAPPRAQQGTHREDGRRRAAQREG